MHTEGSQVEEVRAIVFILTVTCLWKEGGICRHAVTLLMMLLDFRLKVWFKVADSRQGNSV